MGCPRPLYMILADHPRGQKGKRILTLANCDIDSDRSSRTRARQRQDGRRRPLSRRAGAILSYGGWSRRWPRVRPEPARSARARRPPCGDRVCRCPTTAGAQSGVGIRSMAGGRPPTEAGRELCCCGVGGPEAIEWLACPLQQTTGGDGEMKAGIEVPERPSLEQPAKAAISCNLSASVPAAVRPSRNTGPHLEPTGRLIGHVPAAPTRCAYACDGAPSLRAPSTTPRHPSSPTRVPAGREHDLATWSPSSILRAVAHGTATHPHGAAAAAASLRPPPPVVCLRARGHGWRIELAGGLPISAGHVRRQAEPLSGCRRASHGWRFRHGPLLWPAETGRRAPDRPAIGP